MKPFTFGSLFSGIGGFDLGFERSGMECKWQVELDSFRTEVLRKHWPNVPKFPNVRRVGKHNLSPVHLICGGFPCQPFSKAGKQRGQRDDRNLWPEMLRVVSELRPTWVVGENVPELVRMGLDQVLSDLENTGYSAQTFDIPACAVDARQGRSRIWVVAHSDVKGLQRWNECEERLEERIAWPSSWPDEREWFAESGIRRVAHGIPQRMDRIKSLGDAVVPQLVEVIGKFIMMIEQQDNG